MNLALSFLSFGSLVAVFVVGGLVSYFYDLDNINAYSITILFSVVHGSRHDWRGGCEADGVVDLEERNIGVRKILVRMT